MAAVDKRLRRIYHCVIPTFDEYQGQAPFLLTHVMALHIGICYIY